MNPQYFHEFNRGIIRMKVQKIIDCGNSRE